MIPLPRWTSPSCRPCSQPWPRQGLPGKQSWRGSCIASGRPAVAVLLTEDAPPANVPEGYLKLHLLSHRLVKPHGTNLQGLFGVLPNVAWTSEGAIDIAELPQRQLDARLRGEVLEVSCVDKFPKMTNYVVPGGCAHRPHRPGAAGGLPG